MQTSAGMKHLAHQSLAAIFWRTSPDLGLKEE
jgi:hypothetical protein